MIQRVILDIRPTSVIAEENTTSLIFVICLGGRQRINAILEFVCPELNCKAIHADAMQKPIHIPAESESCALGSAMAAGLAAGLFKDFDVAASAMVRMEKVVEPNPAMKSIYDTVYGNYIETYKRLNG